MKQRRILTFVGIAIMACFIGLSATAKADTITFSATGLGLSVPTGPPTATTLEFTFNAKYNTPLGALSVSSLGSVNLTVLNPDGSNPNKGTFTYSLPSGDSFSGTFAGTIQQANQNGDTTYALSYTITGGKGIFTGATGGGTSAGNLNVITGATTDNMTLSISAPGLTAPVPEPATLFLLGTGLVGMTARLQRKRNRRAQEK